MKNVIEMKRILAEYNVKRRKGSEAVKTRRYKKREERHGISRCSSHYTRHCVLVDHSRGQCTLSNRYTHTHLSFPSLVIGRGSEDGSGFVKDFVCLCYGLDIDTYWVWS